jgi:polysaccharide deacetylase 2 family uncharacterized protein YibQ
VNDLDQAMLAAMTVRLSDVLSENARLRADYARLAIVVGDLCLSQDLDRARIAALESTKFVPNKYLVASMARNVA